MTIPMERQAAPASRTEQHHDRTERVLEQYFDGARRQAGAMGVAYGELWDVLRRGTQGGKRLRPELVFTAYSGLGGTDFDAVAPVAAAFELLHTALILHDDVIDRDFKRRGVKNLAGEFRERAVRQGFPMDQAEHRGQSVAIIAGDLALTGAYKLIAGTELAGELRLRLLEELDAAVFASAGGELLDVEFAGAPLAPTLPEVMTMSRLKTAVYSFEAPLRTGAILAGADLLAVETIGTAGRFMGTAYQLVDDLLGTFGDESLTGKTASGDLAEAKSTPLMVYARNTPEWPRIAAVLYQGVRTPEQADEVRRVLESCGARAYVEDLIECYTARARAALEDSQLPPQLLTALDGVLNRAVQRRR